MAYFGQEANCKCCVRSLTIGTLTSYQSPEFHNRLAKALLDQLLHTLEDENVFKLWRAKGSFSLVQYGARDSSVPLAGSSFASSSSSSNKATPFLAYLSHSTPDSVHKRIRLKTILFLQGSALYDLPEVAKRLEGLEERVSNVLVIERAVVEGKVCS